MEEGYALIKRLVKQAIKEAKYNITIPVVVACDQNEDGVYTPKIENRDIEVFAASQFQAEQIGLLHLENAKQQIQLCEAKNNQGEAYAAIPDSWLIRPEHHRSQFIFQFAEVGEGNKLGSAKYPITIPHPKKGYKPANGECPLPNYQRGNWEVIFVLADNSKITIHALNKAEGAKVLEACKAIVDPAYLEGAYLSKNSEVKPSDDNMIQEITVRPRYCSFFPKGRKEGKPEWRVDFNK